MMTSNAGLPDNISIPPPRPKRKPSHPYPRKPFSGSMSMGTEGDGSQDIPASRLPDYSHLAPKLDGIDRLDVAVAEVAQAASAAAAAAAAAVISAAGDQIRAHMQVCMLGLAVLTAPNDCSTDEASVHPDAMSHAVAWHEPLAYCNSLHAQACPPQGFPFFGLPPSMLAQLSLQHLQPQVYLFDNPSYAC